MPPETTMLGRRSRHAFKASSISLHLATGVATQTLHNLSHGVRDHPNALNCKCLDFIEWPTCSRTCDTTRLGTPACCEFRQVKALHWLLLFPFRHLASANILYSLKKGRHDAAFQAIADLFREYSPLTRTKWYGKQGSKELGAIKAN